MEDPTIPCANCGHRWTHTTLVGCLAEDCDCEGYASPGETYTPKTLATAHQERDAAMEKAQRGTDPDWEAAAVEAVLSLVEREKVSSTPFTPDDVWDWLGTNGWEPPREPRALGPILRRLAKADIIRASGFTESRRRHGAPVRLYVAGAEA